MKKIHPQCLTQRFRKAKESDSSGLSALDDRLANMRNVSLFFLLDKSGRKGGRIDGHRANKVRACQGDVGSHLPSLFLPVAFFSPLIPSLLFLFLSVPPKPSLCVSHLFLSHFGVWRRLVLLPPQTGSKNHPGIYCLL